MTFGEESSLYDILDIKPDASPQEVREAYLKAKSAYNRDSVALYTLIAPDEREEMLLRIEEAYQVLSSGEKRRDYDRNHGHLDMEAAMIEQTRPPVSKKIISIDRVPPMEDMEGGGDSLLVAPSTDFSPGSAAAGAKAAPVANQEVAQAIEKSPDHTHVPQPVSEPTTPLDSQPAPPEPAGGALRRATRPTEASIAQEISDETEWKGSFLRKIREGRRISIEEMSNITKVSKTYLMAIEEDNFAKLPAAVFLRGFVTQVAKVLKLPHDKVATAYLNRFQLSKPDKAAR